MGKKPAKPCRSGPGGTRLAVAGGLELADLGLLRIAQAAAAGQQGAQALAAIGCDDAFGAVSEHRGGYSLVVQRCGRGELTEVTSLGVAAKALYQTRCIDFGIGRCDFKYLAQQRDTGLIDTRQVVDRANLGCGFGMVDSQSQGFSNERCA